ncbi:acyl-CoA dehydrogenase family protein [Streptomyces sp. NPDC048192]|uniref:acyl-CoA dehydrogenase family protein n=1 Tax=Streptomyces sp. NPDC048192 TaxID=3365510 RepID=UPI003716E5A6
MRSEPGSAPPGLAAEFRSALETCQAETAALAPRWAALTVPCSRGGRGLDQTAAVLVAEETGRAGRDGTLLDMIAAAETLAAAGPGPAAAVLDGLTTGADVPAVSWWPAPGERHGNDAEPPGHRDFAVGLPAATALLRLPPVPGDGVRFTLVALHGAAWRAQPGLHGERRHRLDLDGRAGPVLTADEGAAPGDGGPSPADLDGIRRAAYVWGLADAAVGAAVRQARQRHQFGVPIGRHQAVAFPLAALTARLRAARLLTHSIAAAADRGTASADDEDKRPFTERVAHLVRHTGALSLDATWCALHVHGAHGLTDDSPAQLLYRRALFHTTLARQSSHRTAVPEGHDR